MLGKRLVAQLLARGDAVTVFSRDPAKARAAATGFFAALLVSRLDAALALWAALFTPPWLVFVARALRGERLRR